MSDVSKRYDRIEFRLGLLFRDSLRISSSPEIVEWSSALTDKLRVIRYFQRTCLEVATEIPAALNRERGKVLLIETREKRSFSPPPVKQTIEGSISGRR